MLGCKCLLLGLCRAGSWELATGLGLGKWNDIQGVVGSSGGVSRGGGDTGLLAAPQSSVRVGKYGVTSRTMVSVSLTPTHSAVAAGPSGLYN